MTRVRFAVRARDWLCPRPVLTRRVRQPCHGSFSFWHHCVPKRCAETVQRAAYWGDGRWRLTIAVITTAPPSSGSSFSLVRFNLCKPEIGFALAAKYTESACGGGRIVVCVSGSVASIGGPAIGMCPRNTHARFLRAFW